MVDPDYCLGESGEEWTKSAYVRICAMGIQILLLVTESVVAKERSSSQPNYLSCSHAEYPSEQLKVKVLPKQSNHSPISTWLKLLKQRVIEFNYFPVISSDEQFTVLQLGLGH